MLVKKYISYPVLYISHLNFLFLQEIHHIKGTAGQNMVKLPDATNTSAACGKINHAVNPNAVECYCSCCSLQFTKLRVNYVSNKITSCIWWTSHTIGYCTEIFHTFQVPRHLLDLSRHVSCTYRLVSLCEAAALPSLPCSVWLYYKKVWTSFHVAL